MGTNRRDFIKYMGVATSSLLAAGVAPSIVAGSDAAAKKQSPIFDSVKIGSLTLKNRMIRSAMGERRADANGSPGPDLILAYNEWAAGGVSMITTGLTCFLKEDDYGPWGAGFYDDSQIPAFKELTDSVHKNGSKICLQLVIVGSKTILHPEKRRSFAPVPLTDPSTGIVVKEGMTKEEIKYCIDAFAKAAVRAQKAGFDAIELHFAHNYLVSKFLVPYFNTRTDEYGGSKIENRARFGFEIVEAVRKAVGKDFPLIVKTEGNDYLGREGNSQKEINYIVQGLADRGIDAVEVTGGNTVIKYGPIIRDILYKEDQSYFSRDARNLAKSVNIPLILTGGNRDAGLMETALEHNKNLVAFGMARTLLSEPDLPLKWQKDTSYTPRCISCNWCIDNLMEQKLQCIFRKDKA